MAKETGMVDQGEKPQKPTAVDGKGPSKPSYPSLGLKNLTGLEGCKPGEEVTITCRAKLMSMQLGKEYGDGAGKNTEMTHRFEIMAASATKGKAEGEEATKRKKRAKELINAGELNENGPGDEGIEAQMYPDDDDEKG